MFKTTSIPYTLNIASQFLFGAIFLLSSTTGMAQGYTSCANAVAGSPLPSGSCFSGAMPGTVNMSGLCVGGNNPTVYIKFVAGSCSAFTIIPQNSGGNMGMQILTTGCSYVGSSYGCENPTFANVPVVLDANNIAGSPTLTPGTTYILQVWGTPGNVNICYNANTPEAPNNECAGATGISPTGSTFTNAGNCAYTGSLNDASTSDPAPGLLCAGSLENTQWTNFQPVAGATSFQIILSAAVCAGPVCAWQFGILSGVCGSLTGEGCAGNGSYCSPGPDGASLAVGSALDGFVLTWNSFSTTGATATITRTGGVPFTGAENFYLVMDGNANSQCQYTISGVNIQPLPIELISFYGRKYNNANYLTWEVASELNNDRFEIERSLDGLNWTYVSMVTGAGTSSQQRTYAMLDNRYDNLINYYRLAQYDFDGTVTYSKMISIDNRIDYNREIVSIFNLMGQEVEMSYEGLKLVKYSDGTSEKVY